MSLNIQYDLFHETDELSEIRRELAAVQQSSENVRKGLFARHKKLETAINELLQVTISQQEEIAKLRILLIK